MWVYRRRWAKSVLPEEKCGQQDRCRNSHRFHQRCGQEKPNFLFRCAASEQVALEQNGPGSGSQTVMSRRQSDYTANSSCPLVARGGRCDPRRLANSVRDLGRGACRSCATCSPSHRWGHMRVRKGPFLRLVDDHAFLGQPTSPSSHQTCHPARNRSWMASFLRWLFT